MRTSYERLRLEFICAYDIRTLGAIEAAAGVNAEFYRRMNRYCALEAALKMHEVEG